MTRTPPLSWFIAFTVFWYRFIVGEDWRLALAVVIALAVSALLVAHRVTAFWVVPIVVITSIALHLRRMSRARR